MCYMCGLDPTPGTYRGMGVFVAVRIQQRGEVPVKLV